MAAIDGHGATLKYASSSPGTTAVGEIISISSPNLSRPMIEPTNMGSSAREFIAGGFYDAGALDFEIQYDPGTTEHDYLTTALTAGTLLYFRITWSDTSTYDCSGYVESFSASAEMEDRITATISVRLTSTVTITGA